MWIYLILFVVSAALLIGIGSCVPGKGKLSNFKENDSIFYPYDSAAGKASREDIELRLKALAESEVPAELNPGAMCYEMAMPPDRIEYVCPGCGEKTLYTNQNDYNLVENANECRNLASSIKGLEVRLEEMNFCRHCYPDTNQKPVLNLYIKYKGEDKEERVEDVSPESLQLIMEFMNGDKTHAYFNDREEPLKDYVDRIRQLLHLQKK